jgi:hypothetical protein
LKAGITGNFVGFLSFEKLRLKFELCVKVCVNAESMFFDYLIQVKIIYDIDGFKERFTWNLNVQKNLKNFAISKRFLVR